jgi:16S rRNA (adenine(1408)-N(1))-methyltransferase
MQVVRGKDVAELDAAGFSVLAARFARLVVDVGAGDGRFAYAYARDHPEALVVALDPVKENLRERSHRARRKPGRGGLPNVLFVWATVERPPPELAGRAGELHVVLPWGKLARGLLLAEAEVLDGLVAMARPGATLDLVLNAEVWEEPVPVEARDLPPLTVDHVTGWLAPRYRARGIEVRRVGRLAREEIDRLPSTWARRLSHGREHPNFVHVEAVVAPDAALAEGAGGLGGGGA